MSAALAGDLNAEKGCCAICGHPFPAWRTFGRDHDHGTDPVALVEHLYCNEHRDHGVFEAAVTGRRFELRPEAHR